MSSNNCACSIHLTGDSLALQPQEFADLLNSLCREKSVESDSYLLGGEVEEFEQYCADLLGKEMAVFMPSGRSPISWHCVTSQVINGVSSCQS